MTEEDIRNLVRIKPTLESFLANPASIPLEAFDSEKETHEKWQKVASRIMSTCWKHKGSVWFQ
jgi:hypothetical protein